MPMRPSRRHLAGGTQPRLERKQKAVWHLNVKIPDLPDGSQALTLGMTVQMLLRHFEGGNRLRNPPVEWHLAIGDFSLPFEVTVTN